MVKLQKLLVNDDKNTISHRNEASTSNQDGVSGTRLSSQSLGE